MSYTDDEVRQLDQLALWLRELSRQDETAKLVHRDLVAQAKAQLDASLATTADSRAAYEALVVEVVEVAKARAEAEGEELETTFRLPSGAKVARHKAADKWVWDDEAVKAWCEEHYQDLLRTKVEVDKVAFKAECTVTDDGTVVDDLTGEVMPGVHVIPGEVTTSIKDGLR